MKNKNKIQVKINNLNLAKQLSRIVFKDVLKKEQVIKDKKRYTRKAKHRDQGFN